MVAAVFLQSGAADEAFGFHHGFDATVLDLDTVWAAIAIQPDGKIIAGGYQFGQGAEADLTLIRYVPGPSPQSAACGNGVVGFGEECDDGNLIADDGCSPACTLEDADADGVLDAIDFCVDAAAPADFRGRSKLTMKGIDDSASPATVRSLSFSGEMRLPPGVDFAGFDPREIDGGRGLTVAVVNARPSQRYSALLGGAYAGPGTQGWRRTGGTWTFTGTPTHGGETKVTIVDRSSVSPGLVKVTVTAKRGTLLGTVRLDDAPFQTVLIFGRYGEASARGECGETRFAAGDCAANVTGSQLVCRR